jgi:hypothetical protein
MAAKKKVKNKKEDVFQVKGEELLGKVKGLIKEGNAKEIIIKNNKGVILITLPLTLGVVGAVLAPHLAAIGAIAALVTECTVLVKRR